MPRCWRPSATTARSRSRTGRRSRRTLPDSARLTITYRPAGKCVELKSLKYYVIGYRNVGIFQEHATARIAEDLFRVLEPKSLSVRTVYNIRGGFETTCTVTLPLLQL